MIIVKVELHSAVTGRVTELGRATISNDGSSPDPNVGHYAMRIAGSKRIGTVTNFRRSRLNVWYLLTRALISAGYK